ncbi:glycosyltransferase family 2 protein [Flavobacterium psychrophilum]|uniref:glycosyltransferase family 2 protein n=1 Tax=Flavobacterium psychrophilum TaxID=96345 RepID=UPI001D088AA0|nr:glycosyltransferase family 2 protein [Flavobacterium psychrophilum]EKT3956847.1 glycosyltransferase family 2 protein [Flavobacterium psychrophilum]EKT4508450.1 glycosyltransferase family 2 protein [Flavobacterium psychrophilum]MCB6088585.1 glycosyltransferase [Flavobacterium psychrophilum]
MNNPIISVIMPVYNASKYLKESIESILNQTFRDFEFIILNDNSTDNSLEIISDYQQKDPRIIIINKPVNLGPANLRNEGIACAKGEFIALMDADDISELSRFEKQIAVFNKNPEIDLCATNYTKFGENIQPEYIKHYEFHKEIKVNFLSECYIANPTILFRKRIITGYNYDPVFFPVDDYELLSRLISKFTFYNIQESLLKYRWHQTNISQTKKVNIEELKNKIKNQQLNDFCNALDIEVVSLVLNYKEPQDTPKLIQILQYKNNVILNNKVIQKFDQTLFEKKINDTIKRNFIKAKNPNLQLFWFFYKNEKQNFKELKTKYKIKTFLKSLIRIR